MAVSDVGECGDKDGDNGAGSGYAVQLSHSVCVVIWEIYLGCDGGT